MRTRAERRHSRQKWVRRVAGYDSNVMHTARKVCSSPFCCGNPRRTPGRNRLTRQELLSEYELRENEMRSEQYLRIEQWGGEKLT